MGPPLAWMGCCLLIKEHAQQGHQGQGDKPENEFVPYLYPASLTVLLKSLTEVARGIVCRGGPRLQLSRMFSPHNYTGLL